MKNFKKLNLAVATLAVASAMAPVSAFAADTNNSKEMTGHSSIEFTGIDGDITLQQAPDFEFKSHDLAGLKNTKEFTADGSTFKVLNLSGNDKGYYITAQASDLKTEGDAYTLPTDQFFLQATNGDESQSSIKGNMTGFDALDIFNKKQTVAVGNKDANGTIESGKTNAKLTLKNDNVKALAYKGTIDYTLNNGPVSSDK